MLYQSPTDRDLTFYLQVYRDPRQARWCLTQLRKVYPGARVLIISDGDDRPEWLSIARKYRAQYVAGQRLYSTEHGGRMIQRMLELYAENPTAYLIKIDTDTWTHRRLKPLPTGCSVFGTLEWSTWGGGEPLGYPNVQGGFVGYTRAAAMLIRSSKLLISTRLKDYAGTYADVEDIRKRAEKGMVSSDFLTRYACRCLGIESVEFDDVKSRYRGWVPETQGQFAFTHPHKEVASRPALEHVVRDALPEPIKLQIKTAISGIKDVAAMARGLPKPTPRMRSANRSAAPRPASSDVA
ncbi:MAG: hypothetical protein AAGG38_03890 [Planctomycetota bacterium]